MTYAVSGCAGCGGLGAGAATGIAAGAIAPVSSSAQNAITRLANTAGQIMEDPFLDDVIYSRSRYLDAYRRQHSALTRLVQATGLVEVPEPEAKQLILGAVKQAKSTIQWARVLAYSSSPRARQLEQRVIVVVGNLLGQTRQLLDEAKSAKRSRTGTSGLGVIVFVGLLVGAYVLSRVLSDTSEAAELGQAIRDCVEAGESECSREVLADLLAAYERQLQAARENDKEKPGPFDSLAGTVMDVLKPIIYVGAAGVGLYLLWVLSPVLLGAGRKIRGAAKKRYATPVKANRRRRRRRTSR